MPLAGLASVVVGNGVILASTLYFQLRAPGRGGDVAVGNFERIDARVYRGGAPSEAALRDLAGAGVKTVIDLRAEDDLGIDGDLLGELGMVRHALPVRDGQVPTRAQTDRFLRVLERADGPVFLHCGAGVGRTGAMTAFYLNSTGQTHGTMAMRRILAIGPPSLEQLAFSLRTAGGDYERPGSFVTAISRVLDSPRRIWHNLT